MTIIKEVIVGHRTFKVWRDHPAAVATQARGQALCDDGLIMLDPGLKPDIAAVTLLHESFHCAFEQSTLVAGKGVKDAVVEVDDLLEEKLCTWLESVVVQLYRDNPALFEALRRVSSLP